MRKLLQRLPFGLEFAIVVIGAFAALIISRTGGLSEMAGWRIVALQAGVAAVLGLFLWGRGWTAARLGFDTHWMDGLWAIPLAVVAYGAMFLTFAILVITVPGLIPHAGAAPAPFLSPYVVVALVLMNAFFEEFFIAGYLIAALKEKSLPNVAINLGVAIRLLTRLFLGTASAVQMIPIGLIFGTYYARAGRLWPLILAHVLLNIYSYAHYIKW